MLTRLKVNGFKNLLDVDLRFGPFTCIAGPNGVGKSNLFDAIAFLGSLAEKSLAEAAAEVRGDPRSKRAAKGGVAPMGFEAEMLIPPAGVDRLGQEAEAATTFVRYAVEIGWRDGRWTVERETLDPIGKRAARGHLAFGHSVAWRESAVRGQGRRNPLISTDRGEGVIRLHFDRGPESAGGGRPREFVATRLPRTVLSDANAAESSTAVLVQQEMRSWRRLQLEPAALRRPDELRAPARLGLDGRHLPATLARLAGARLEAARAPDAGRAAEAAATYAELANRLAELVPDVRSLRVDVDPRRELLTLRLEDGSGVEHPAGALSDGILRFLALATLWWDTESTGLICVEEPENGIHPRRLPAMLELLRDLAVDPELEISEANPLRQVIVNTHSPWVVAQIPDEALLMALRATRREAESRWVLPVFQGLADTWRARAEPEEAAVSRAEVLAFLQPMQSREVYLRTLRDLGEKPSRRVIDREDLNYRLPFDEETGSPSR